MRIEPLGDRAFILRDLDAPAYEIASRLNSKPPPGVVEAVASYDTVGVYVQDGFNQTQLDLSDWTDLRSEREIREEPNRHLIPVCYDLGEDLGETAKSLGIDAPELVKAHGSVAYTCYAVGFCPGFAYLGHLPESIRGVPRRPSPRARVEPGTVGITGSQTGVYPLPRPGGWALIGRTPLTLVDIADGYFPIQAGDTVQFIPIDPSEFAARRGERL